MTSLRCLLTHRGSSPLRLQNVSIHPSGPEADVYPCFLLNVKLSLRPEIFYSSVSLCLFYKCLLFDHRSDRRLGGWLYSLSLPNPLPSTLSLSLSLSIYPSRSQTPTYVFIKTALWFELRNATRKISPPSSLLHCSPS